MNIYIIIAVIALGVIIYLLNTLIRQIHDTHELVALSKNDQAVQLVNQNVQQLHTRLDSLGENMTKHLSQSFETSQKQHEHTSSIIQTITEHLTRLQETNKQVLGFSEQLQQLENILKNPKQRGVLGEYWLQTLLANVLPPNLYQMQYSMGKTEDGHELIADAVVFVNDQIIPIDAKFTLENYNRISEEADPERRAQFEREFKADVKKRIDETSKYINPEKGTLTFAFMFVPAEGVYHNLLTSSVGGIQVNQQNLLEYAFSKNVTIVSPTSFYAYLQTVLLGLKKMQMEKSVLEVIKNVAQLSKHIKAYEMFHDKLGKHLVTATGAFDEASGELRKIDKDVLRITAETQPAINPPIDAPIEER